MALQTSELWDALWRTRGTRREYKFIIDGTEYGADAEVSHSVDNGLYEEFGIGNAACGKLTVSFFAESVPRGAKIERFVRLVNGEQTSEWLPAGVYFANRRSVEDDNYWTVEAFDVMRKAEQPWNPDQSLEFPLPMTDAVNEFCRIIMDCEPDERTVINPAYTVDYPTSDPESDTGENYTIRQVLQWIAAAHGGNWIITPSGALRLVPVVNISASESVLGTENGEIIDFGGFALLTSAAAATDGAEGDTHNVGRDLVSASDNGTTRPVSRITLNVDDENVITAGDDTGLELTADCPYATQEMADGILARLAGYQYRMFEAAAVNISPAAELGDLIEADGIYSVVAQISDDGSGYPDIAAPGEAEMEDEFPTGAGPVTREFNRKIAKTRAAIEKSAEEVRVYVKDEVDGALAEVDVKLDSIKLEVSQETGEDGKVYARLTLTVGPNQYSGLIMIEGNLDVSGQISADALYAALGDIADLTVNRLSTSRRIVLYLKRDDSDDNYVRIQDQYIELVTGTTDGSTEQATTPTGLALYWEDDPDGEGVTLGTDGYPYKGGQRIFTTTKTTDWPVWVYVYDEQIKRSIGFEMLDGIYTPVDYFGHGDGKGGSRGRLLKSKTGLELLYTTSTSRGSKELGLKAGDGGYLDLYGLRRTTALDFSGWEYGSFRENVEGLSETLTYSVDFDEEGRPIRITDDGDNVMTIQW